jgi:uncharacterized protein YecT (DUF1311 family)
MNKFLICSLVVSASLVSGCDKLKNKKEPEVKAEVPQELADWSCTAQANIDQIQTHLKDEYVKELERKLRNSNYAADQTILDKIKKGIKFELKGVTTLTQDPNAAKMLECSSQLIVHLPKGLQKRAENAYKELPCDEGCDGEYYEATSSLHDYLDAGEHGLVLANDQLKSDFKYSITKTDKEGLSLSVPTQTAVIDGVAYVAKTAAQYEAYVNENKQINANAQKYNEEEAAQTALAQKAMDIRKKEIESEKTQAVDRLNAAWDNLSVEEKAEHKQEQTSWFEKRDVDCKVLAQKPVYQLSDSEKETYQRHNRYWTQDMEQQNVQIQYNKCFIERSNSRADFLEDARR